MVRRHHPPLLLTMYTNTLQVDALLQVLLSLDLISSRAWADAGTILYRQL
jgi:hypothetical protein